MPDQLISVLAASRLFGHHHSHTWRLARRGVFGPVSNIKHKLFVSLSAVERHAGRQFSESHIKAANYYKQPVKRKELPDE